MEPMYRGITGNKTTELSISFHASTDNKITVFDTSIFPDAPNWLTVRMPNKSCLATFRYTGISGNEITGLTFEESDIPLGQTATYPVGSSVYWSVTNKLLNNMITNIENGGGGGGTSDYNALANKPKINSIELKGNKTPADLGLATIPDLNGEAAIRAVADSSLQTAVNGKVNIQQSASDAGKSMVIQSDGKLAPQMISPSGSVAFSDITGQPTDNTNLASALNGKVDTVTGKGLSSNDYTSTEKTKLAGIEEEAQKNVQSDWSASSGDSFIKNKPTIPVKTSDLTNDSNYQTSSNVDTKIGTHNANTTSHADIRTLITTEATARTTADADLQTQIDALEAKALVKDIVGTHAALTAYDVSKLVTNDRIQVLQDETHSNAVSYYRYTGGSQPTCWEFIGSSAETYTKTESDARFVAQTRKVNGKALSSDITLSASDVNALPDTTTLADLSGDATHRTVTDTEKSEWNNKVDKVTGKGLSSNDYTEAEKTKLAGIETSAQVNVLEKVKVNGTEQTITDKSVDITVPTELSALTGDATHRTVTDAEKSTWNGKQDALTIDTELKTDSTNPVTNKAITEEIIKKLGTVYTSAEDGYIAKVDSADHVLKVMAAGTSSVSFADITGQPSDNTNLSAALSNKVDKVTGKGLSTNDYTDAEKTKLAGVETNAQVNKIESVKLNGTEQTVTDKTVSLTVDKTTVGLSNVDNTSDADKPVSTATQTALNGKENSIGTKGTAFNKSFGTIAGTVCEGNDSRLSDTRNPKVHASSHTNGTDDIQTASGSQKGLLSADDWTTFNSKQNTLTFDSTPTESSSNPVTSGGVHAALTNKVDKVSGKGLSSNDYTSAEKTKLSGIAENAQVNVLESVKDSSGNALTITDKSVTLSKSAVGLGNVDNTSDLSKPVSTAMQTALDGKEDSIGTKGTAFNKSFGTASGTVCEGNDARLSDSRTPTAHKDSHKKDGGDALALDATQITSGVLDVDRVPRAAFQKMVSVADTTARLALTTAQVTTGDTVHQLDSNVMYFVKDDSKLGTENAFQIYLSTVDWSAITNKPDKYAPTGHASSHAASGSDPLTPADIGAATSASVTTLSNNFNSHVSASNPHGITKATIGLGNVNNTADADKPISTATQTALDAKEPKITTKNTAFNKSFGSTADTVCEGNDSRLSNARTPTAHASSHASGQSDAISPADIGAASSSALTSHTGNTSNPHGVTKAQVGLGSVENGAQINKIETVKVNGTALTITDKSVDVTVPDAAGLISTHNADTSAHADIRSALNGKEDSIGTKGTAFNKSFGTTSDTVCEGNDARLSDARTPISHASSHVNGTDDIQTATSTRKGLLSSTDWSTFNGKQNALPAAYLHIVPVNANLTKSNIDSNKVYLTYTWELTTGVSGYPAKWISTLSTDYLTRTLQVYGSDKTTLLATYTFTRTLDSDRNLVSEVLD